MRLRLSNGCRHTDAARRLKGVQIGTGEHCVQTILVFLQASVRHFSVAKLAFYYSQKRLYLPQCPDLFGLCEGLSPIPRGLSTDPFLFSRRIEGIPCPYTFHKNPFLHRSHFGYKKVFFSLHFSSNRVILTRIKCERGNCGIASWLRFPFFRTGLGSMAPRKRERKVFYVCS